MRTITWVRIGTGYEVSSKGDKRFSAFYAILPNGNSIELEYQTKVKGYKTWREGKGKPPLDTSVDMFAAYLKLWRTWCDHNPELIVELLENIQLRNDCLKDSFASTRVNQAHALSVILNERLQNVKDGNKVQL